VREVERFLGTTQRAGAVLNGRCVPCRRDFTTDPADEGKVVEEMRFNGKFVGTTGMYALEILCPLCHRPIQFRTQKRISTTIEW